MKQIKDYHKEYNKYPEYKNFNVAYNYDSKNKNWKFAGYKCVKCGRVLKQKNIVPRHQLNCRDINTPKVYNTHEIDPKAKVLNLQGNTWKPLDFNHI